MSSKSISKSALWQLAGKFSLQGIAFFTTPIFTRLLAPEDYGYAALYMSWLSIFTLIVGLQTSGSIANARIKYGEPMMNGYISSVMTISVIAFVAILIPVVALRNWLSKLVALRQDLLILAVVQSFFVYVVAFYTAKLDQFKRVEKSTLLSVAQSVITIAISLFAVLNARSDKAVAKIYAQAVPSFLFGFFLLFFIYTKGKKIWDSSYNKFCIGLTLPLLLHALGGLIFCQSDRIMIAKMQTQEMLGFYSVSYALCCVLITIAGALNVAWVPFYFDFKKQNKIDEILRHSKRYVWLYTVLSSGFILLSYDVFKLMAPQKYWGGMRLLPIFVFAFFFDFLYLFPVNFEFYHCQTKMIPIATLLSSIFNILINFLLIPKFDITGAAIGTFAACFFKFAFHYFVSNFIMKETFEYGITFFVFPTLFLFFFITFSYFFKDLILVRWSAALLLGGCLLIDIKRNKTIF